METIFISIASYRDKLLKTTIEQAYSKAKHKSRLVFGIFEQAEVETALDITQFEFNNQIRYQRIDPHLTQGVCWARKQIQTMFQNETYYLQIDAHTLFENDWDEFLINTLNEIEKYHPNPIISNYPNGFNPSTFELLEYDKTTIPTVWNLEERNDKFALLGFHPPVGGYFPSNHEIVHGYHLGACFIFSRGHFVINVPYDPNIFFGGEEPLLSVRAWTHGYNIFHTKHIPAYHCWDKNYGGVVHSDNVPASNNNIELAKEYIQRFVDNQVEPEYRAGNIRTFDEYMQYSGLDFYNKTFKYNVERFFNTAYTDNIVY